MAGKWALVTGGGGDIGRATALRLAALGINIVALDLVRDKAEDTARLVRDTGLEAKALALDVSDGARVAEQVGQTARDVGGFSCLANIAGIYSPGAIETITSEALERVFAVNVFSLFHVTQAVLPGMIAAREGSIVSLSSVHAQKGYANSSAYAASKGAVISFTRALAREQAANGIRVNALAPGPIDTEQWRGGDTGEALDRRRASRTSDIPLGRLGVPEDIADAAAFLLTAASGFITGQVLAVGGGEVMA